jgi:hypothetical protein
VSRGAERAGPRRAGAAVLLLSLLLAGCGGSNDVARVGRAPIARGTVSHWEAIAASLGASRPAPDPLVAPSGDRADPATSRQWALSYLIAQDRTAADAAELELEVSRNEARHALEDLRYEGLSSRAVAKPQQARLKALLASPATSEADRVSIMKDQLQSARLEAVLRDEAQKALPASLVAAYYAAHRKHFITPEKRNVYVIQSFTKRNAELARREIEAGETIAHVVERRNDEPGAGGAKRGMTRASLTHAYEQDYFRAKLHELVGPRKAQIYYLFYVSYIQPRQLWPFGDEQLQIRQALIAGPERETLTELVRRVNRRWRARTRCAAGYVVGQCGGGL